MKLIPLKDIVEIHYGEGLKSDFRDNSFPYPVYGANGIVGRYKEYIVDHESIIIGRKGSCGEITLASPNFWPIDTTFYTNIKDHSKLNNYYLYYALKAIDLKKLIITTSIPGINRDALYNVKIFLPDKLAQEKVVNILKKAESSLEKRRQTIRLADEFLKSVFLEIFGDPESNPKKWPLIQFDRLGEIKKDIVANGQILSECKCVGLEHIESQTGELLGWDKFDKSIRSSKFKFSKDQVLYGKLRPYLNKVSLPYIDGVCSTDILPISAINQVSNRYFIAYLMRTKYFVSMASSKSTGANLPRINPSQIEEFMIYKPPFEKQQKFADLVQKVERLKEKQKQSETELLNLFNTLMQREFK